MSSYQRLSALDASFLDIEDAGTHMHVAAVLLFEAAPLTVDDGALDIDRIRSFVGSLLHRLPRYRQRLAYIPIQRHPVWIDDPDFNIVYHVRHTRLPAPGNVRLLKRLAGRIMSQKLDPGKPLWELWVVEGLEAERFALIMKVHHCMVDGVSGIDVLSTILRADDDASIPETPTWSPHPVPKPGTLLLGEAMRRARTPSMLFERARDAARAPHEALASAREAASAIGQTLAAGFGGASSTPLNPVHIGPHRRFDWLSFDLAAAKSIAERTGGTVNDVVLATVAGAIARFLRGRGQKTRGIDFRVMVPVSVRPEADRGKLGNRVALMLASLPIDEPDPRQRLLRVIEETRERKRSKAGGHSGGAGSLPHGRTPAAARCDPDRDGRAMSRDRTVYSSGKGRVCPHCGMSATKCVCRANPRSSPRAETGDGIVRVRREVKGRRGKAVTTISGVPLSSDELRELAGELKRRCGTGGSAKDGVIEIQGEHRDVLVDELTARGYTVKRAGG